jgi:hypothetical protein
MFYFKIERRFNKMKAQITIALMAVMIIAAFALPMALAEDNGSVSDDSSAAIALYNDTSNVSPGLVISPGPVNTEETNITPEMQDEAAVDDNATVQFGQIGWNSFKLWFTWNQEKRAEIELELARLRLIQARVAAKNNNTDAMEKALDAHEKIMERLNETMAKLDGASDMRGLNSSALKLVALERAIQVHELKIGRLTDLLDKINLTDDQRVKIENRISHVENVTARLRDLNQARMEKIKTKIMAVGNMTDEQAGKFIEQRQEAIKNRVEQRLQK